MLNLKYLRQQKGFTQLYMANLLNITPQQYQRYESGKSSPRLDDACKLADYFNVSLDYLLGRAYFDYDIAPNEIQMYNELNNSNKAIVMSLIKQLLDAQ